MLSNPLPRKLVQISEEALPPVHVPLILGNDLFILTQQDVRKTEDSRSLIVSKVSPNGLPQFFQRDDLQCQQVLNSLLEFLKNTSQECQQAILQRAQQDFASNLNSCPQPMDVSVPEDTVASISQQLQWSKCINTSAPFPIHYSHGTSTTDIDCTQDLGADKTSMACNCRRICAHCRNRPRYFDKSTNVQETQIVCDKKSNESLDAREQLKKKKLRSCFLS